MTSNVAHARSVQSWRDLDRYLSQSLLDDYFTFENDSVRQVSTYIKSYIVERSEPNLSALDSWTPGFQTVYPTEEPGLILGLDANENTYFVDCRDERFALVHSIGLTSEVDQTLERMVDESRSGFDRAWLPSDFLFSSRSYGSLKGFRFAHIPLASGVKLNVEQSDPSEDIAVKLPPSFGSGHTSDTRTDEHNRQAETSGDSIPKRTSTSVRSSSLTAKDSDTAMNDYLLIRDSGVFQGRRSLDWVQYHAREESGGTINHTLYSHGKFTASGTSIGLHRYLVEDYLNKYARGIRTIEAEHWMGWAISANVQYHTGEPLYLMFPDDLEIIDLQSFARSVFRAARPFRLFGATRVISNNRIDVEGIDLHTGDPFSVELTKQWMRVYLPQGTCGNVVARLLTNIQRTTVSGVKLFNGSGEQLLSG